MHKNRITKALQSCKAFFYTGISIGNIVALLFNMKVLHTSDWHIGQMLYQFDRTKEHEFFLNWLVQTLQEEQIDLLLVSGDIFDLANPSAQAIRMFYEFIQQCIFTLPHLQIIITAGNHDSPSRLEAPIPLLPEKRVHIIGQPKKKPDGTIDFDSVIVPIWDRADQPIGWCLAVPYLRTGDYFQSPEMTYAEAITQFYQDAFYHIKQVWQPGQSILAMGHLHMLHVPLSEEDQHERIIRGGIEGIPPEAFPKEICYVALGHIHKAQQIGGYSHIRYAGSPLPMSFSEKNYTHQVIILNISDNAVQSFTSLPVPVHLPLLSIPQTWLPISEVLEKLHTLPELVETTQALPYLEVRVLLHEPIPGLRHQVEKALENKAVRLAKISVAYPEKTPDQSSSQHPITRTDKLRELDPAQVFANIYQSRFQEKPSTELVKLFQQAYIETIDKSQT